MTLGLELIFMILQIHQGWEMLSHTQVSQKSSASTTWLFCHWKPRGCAASSALLSLPAPESLVGLSFQVSSQWAHFHLEVLPEGNTVVDTKNVNKRLFSKLEPDLKEENEPLTANYSRICPHFSVIVHSSCCAGDTRVLSRGHDLGYGPGCREARCPRFGAKTFYTWYSYAWAPLNSHPNLTCRIWPKMVLRQPLWLLYLLALHWVCSRSFIHSFGQSVSLQKDS